MADKTAVNDATERKKALLVYKSNLHSASDDEEDASDEGEEDVASLVNAGRVSMPMGNASHYLDHVQSPAKPSSALAGKEAEMEVVEYEEGGVQVEKDDDESLNAPSDDDLDSTTTPRRSETDEDVEGLSQSPAFSRMPPSNPNETNFLKKNLTHTETDSPHDVANRPPSPSSVNSQSVENTTAQSLKSGTSNVGVIIAARRRTVARKECQVCHEPRNGRRALLCVQCKCMYHTSCFRQTFSKVVQGSHRQWYCPDCEPIIKGEPSEKPPSNTPRKQPRVDSAKSRVSRAVKSSSASRGKGDYDDRSGQADGVTGTAAETEVQRVTDLALRGGKNINVTILEKTGDMLHITQTLTKEITDIMGSTWLSGNATSRGASHDPGSMNGSNNDKHGHQHEQVPSTPPPPFLLVPSSSSVHDTSAASAQIVAASDNNAHSGDSNGLDNPTAVSSISEKDVLLRRVYNGLDTLKQLLEQLQVTGIQFEVDFIKEIKAIPDQDRKTNNGARKAQGSTGTAGRSVSGSKGKSGASRLYSSKQIQKLEEWYQRSSRPESSEIHAMYRIINCPDFADPELQPEGISVKQIRIWFDNRRAKERLDYMRLKMKDISTTDMDADSVKKMKAAYIDEAKEVLEARVSRMRENGLGPGQVVDEADMALIANVADPTMPGSAPKSGAGKGHSALVSGSKDGVESLRLSSAVGSSNQKKRIRIDYVASVRKVIKDARDAGKNEEETKALRTAAIERARERLHVPFKNARTGPSKPLGKEEVSHIKMKILKLLEEDAPAEELTDVIELLLSLIIPHDVLVESGLQQQLDLILLAHKDNKELVRQTKKLQEEFQSILEKGDAPSVVAAMTVDSSANKKRKDKSRSLLLNVDTDSLPGTPGSSPRSGPTPSPESRRPRVKFSLAQLVKLEKYFHKEDTPSKKKLDKIAARLNGIASLDSSSDAAQRSIDYKQIRCWFYKRRSANQPPQALSGADLHIDGAASSSSSSSDTESDDDNKLDKGAKSRTKLKPRSTSSGCSSAKRKAPPIDDRVDAKRLKKEGALESTELKGMKSDEELADSMNAARIFNVRQLATIIEEYEKNSQPSEARLEELLKVLNQVDHKDEQSANAVGVTKQQIEAWFSNRRAKERLDLINMKTKETRVGGQESSSSDSEENESDDEMEMATIGHVNVVVRDLEGEAEDMIVGQ